MARYGYLRKRIPYSPALAGTGDASPPVETRANGKVPTGNGWHFFLIHEVSVIQTGYDVNQRRIHDKHHLLMPRARDDMRRSVEIIAKAQEGQQGLMDVRSAQDAGQPVMFSLLRPIVWETELLDDAHVHKQIRRQSTVPFGRSARDIPRSQQRSAPSRSP